MAMYRFILVSFLLFCSVAYAENTVKIQVLTSDQTEVGQYNDAQYFTVSDDTNIGEWKKEHQKDIDAEKDARIARWIDAIRHPVQPVELTTEELVIQKQQIENSITALQEQLNDTSQKIASKAVVSTSTVGEIVDGTTI